MLLSVASDERLRSVLLADTVVRALVGAVLVLGSWDALYRLLDIPQLRPALLAQLGGTAALALAYTSWHAAARGGAVGAAVTSAAIANGLGFLLVAAWLATKWDQLERDWSVGGVGKTLLVLLTLALGALAALERPRALRELRTEAAAPPR